MVWSLRQGALLVFLTGLVGLVGLAVVLIEAARTDRPAVLAAFLSVPFFLVVAWIHGHVARAARTGELDHHASRAAWMLMPLASSLLAGAAFVAPFGLHLDHAGRVLAMTALSGCGVLAIAASCHVRLATPDAPWHRVPALARDRLAARRLVAALALTGLTLGFAAVFLVGVALLPGTDVPLGTAAVPALLAAATAYLWLRARRMFALREDVDALGHEARGLVLLVTPLLAGILMLAPEVPGTAWTWLPAWLAIAITALCLAIATDPLVRLSGAGA